MNVPEYLKRIKVLDTEVVSLKNLTHLQQQHMLHIPFENFDIHLGKKIVLDFDAIFEKIVLKKRGGFCYELNGLFYLLLEKLGYTVKRISTKVCIDEGRIGEEFDHLAIIARLDHQDWLVDVGFGNFSFIPLKIALDEIQDDGRTLYKITKEDDTYYGVHTLDENKEWKLGYLFTDKERAVADFTAQCHYNQTSPDVNFTQRRYISLPNLNGRVTLTDSKLKINERGVTKEKAVHSDAEFRKHLKHYFKMIYEY